jgi:hypothetical protein
LRRAYKQNPEAVKKWLDEEYPAIEKFDYHAFSAKVSRRSGMGGVRTAT